MEVFAGPDAQLSTLELREDGKAIYLWGRMAHPDRSGEDLLAWCAQIIEGNDLAPLSQLIGLFVLLIDDRRNRSIHMFSDVLGIRPWFVVTSGSRLVAGSSIWPIRDAGLCGKSLDYDAIASWLYFGYDLTGGSLFQDCRRLAPRYVLSSSRGVWSQREYAPLLGENRRLPLEEIADWTCHKVSRAIDRLCASNGKVIVPLSGGYDSRLIAALAAQKKLDARIVSVDEGLETRVAAEVAEAVKLPIDIVPNDGSSWNMFHEPFHSLPEGLPITRQVSDVVARRYPGLLQINGFIGDMLVRSTGIKSDREMELEPVEVLAPQITRRRQLKGLRFDLFDPALFPRIEQRAQEGMRKLIVLGKHWGKPFLYSGLYGRQRCFTSNNILAHLDVAEPVVPFYSWDLILSRFVNDYDCFTWETYELLLKRHFPKIADIPHPTRLPDEPPRRVPISRCTVPWARKLLFQLQRRDFLPMLSRRKALPRLLSAAMGGRAKDERMVVFLWKLFLLEQKLKSNGMTLDWGKI